MVNISLAFNDKACFNRLLINSTLRKGVDMVDLKGKVAIVTGASRGVGKGIALGLGEAGAIVYVTGRTIEEGKSSSGWPGTIGQTAAEVTQLGGTGIAVQCDHRSEKD